VLSNVSQRPLPPSHHHRVPPPTFAFAVPTYHIPLSDYTIYIICIEQPSFSSTPSPHAKPFPLCHTSLSPSNYIILRVHAPHYRINATATVAVTSPRAYVVAATPQLPSNYYSCFVFMTTFSFIFLLVRFHPPLRRRRPRFFPSSVSSLPRGLRVGIYIYCYTTTMYQRPPIVFYSSSEEVRESKEKKKKFKK